MHYLWEPGIQLQTSGPTPNVLPIQKTSLHPGACSNTWWLTSKGKNWSSLWSSPIAPWSFLPHVYSAPWSKTREKASSGLMEIEPGIFRGCGCREKGVRAINYKLRVTGLNTLWGLKISEWKLIGQFVGRWYQLLDWRNINGVILSISYIFIIDDFDKEFVYIFEKAQFVKLFGHQNCYYALITEDDNTAMVQCRTNLTIASKYTKSTCCLPFIRKLRSE